MAAEFAALEFREIAKSFGAVHALQHVSFGVRQGEVHAIVGENGAGKSTLLKILAGIVKPDHGGIYWHGQQVHLGSPRDALARGIGLVYQETLAFRNLSVSANIFAGRELTSWLGRLKEREMQARTRELLAELHLAISPDTLVESLSTAHCQLVQVARALAHECHILVLDEPTTSLTEAETEHLFSVLERLRSGGTTLIYVSHRLPEVFRLADRITVLRDGRYVATYERSTTDHAGVVRAMVGRDLPPPNRRASTSRDTTPALEVRRLTRRPWCEDITLSIARGEIVGVFGLVGSGRSELLETIFGVATADRGEIVVDGRAISVSTAEEAVRAGVVLVPEDRQRQGLFFNLSVRDNLLIPRERSTSRILVRARAERRDSQALLSAWGIRAAGIDVLPDTLSGGNQQKLVLAKWLAVKPRVLLLDEPTKGVDVGAKYDIHEIIRREASHGVGCLLVSSDLPEVLGLADRILVMREGRICGELSADASEEAVMHLATAQPVNAA